jgi:hypothetical protein
MRERVDQMGADIYWNTPPLGGEVGDDEIDAAMEWAKPEGDNPEAAAALHSVWGVQITAALVFRVAEGLGHYFRANMDNWSNITAEMHMRGMIGDDLIPEEAVRGNPGIPVTKKQIWKAFDADTHPILPLLTSEPPFYMGSDQFGIPGLWVRRLCFMERAAELGDGFRVN